MRRRDPRVTIAIAAILAGCGGGGAGLVSDGGGGGGSEAGVPIDAPIDSRLEIDATPPPPPIDAFVEPPPPALGAQLHRAGRPGTRTLLLGTLASTDVQATLRDTYDRAADPAAWKTLALPTGVTVERELATNLALLDGFDKGRTAIVGAGCGNTSKYLGPAGPSSYLFMADLFADDQLYVDTLKPTCGVYFDLELARATNNDLFANTCGGRTPIHDVIDMIYSVTAAGANGIELTGRIPKLGDGVAAHAEVTTTFPFLGAPH